MTLSVKESSVWTYVSFLEYLQKNQRSRVRDVRGRLLARVHVGGILPEVRRDPTRLSFLPPSSHPYYHSI
jgi:hypothetical protein